MADGSLATLYLTTKLKEGDKVLAFYDPHVSDNVFRWAASKVVLDLYRLKVYQELNYPGTGDPSQVCYDMVKNTLLADTKKEIKGIWTSWEGYGIPAARAAVDMGRKEIVVVTINALPTPSSRCGQYPCSMLLPIKTTMPITGPSTCSKISIRFLPKTIKDGDIWFSLPYSIQGNPAASGLLLQPVGLQRVGA